MSNQDRMSNYGNLNIAHGSFSAQGNIIGSNNTVYLQVNNGANADDNQEIASEIQEILDGLSGTYSNLTPRKQMSLATQAFEIIEQNASLRTRVMNSIKAGGVAAIGQFLNHPAASFLIAAFEEWSDPK